MISFEHFAKNVFGPPLLGSSPSSAFFSLTLLLGRVAPAGQPRRLQHTPPRLPDALVRLSADHFPGLFQIQQVADREVLFGLEVVQVRRDRTLQAVRYRGLPVHYMCIARSHDASGEQREEKKRRGEEEKERKANQRDPHVQKRTNSSSRNQPETHADSVLPS